MHATPKPSLARIPPITSPKSTIHHHTAKLVTFGDLRTKSPSNFVLEDDTGEDGHGTEVENR
jgi:hypothetical protein